MSYAPQTLTDLANYWRAHGGQPLGIVGNAAHTSGYHLGKDRIVLPDYSVRLARDKAGFTNASSAIDLGRLNGSLTQLRKFSIWLVAELKTHPTLRHDFKEVIYSPDGVKVQRYDGPDNRIYTGPGNGDSSHTAHTHISYLRDSEFRSKIAAFAGYFPVAPPAPGDPTMPTLTSYIPGYDAVIKVTANVRSAPTLLPASILRAGIKSPETWDVTGWVKGDVDPDGGSDQWITRWSVDKWEYTAKSNVTSLTAPAGTPTVDTTPFNQADLDAAAAQGATKGAALGQEAEAQRIRTVLGL